MCIRDRYHLAQPLSDLLDDGNRLARLLDGFSDRQDPFQDVAERKWGQIDDLALWRHPANPLKRQRQGAATGVTAAIAAACWLTRIAAGERNFQDDHVRLHLGHGFKVDLHRARAGAPEDRLNGVLYAFSQGELRTGVATVSSRMKVL